MRDVQPPEPQNLTLRRLAHALVGTWPRRIAWLAAAVVIVATALAGGFAAVTPAATRSAAPGDWVKVGPVRVAVTSWTVRSDVEPDSLEDVDGADAWLIVEAKITTRSGASEQYPDRVMELPDDLDVAATEPESVVLLRDGTLFPDLQPGLPERVALLWPVREASVAETDALDIDLRQLRQTTSQVDGSEIWRPGDLAGTVTAPRDDATGDELVETEEW